MLATVLELLLGVFCCATAVIFIRLSEVHPVLLAGLRCLVAAAALAPLWLAAARRHGFCPRTLRRAALPGLFLAVHFITWVYGARAAVTANASVIVNMAPLVMPVVLFLAARERPTAGELAGTLLAVGGMLVLSVGDLDLSPAYFRGDVTCFISMLFFTVYLALGRRNRDVPSVWLYVVPLYAVAGLVATLVALPMPGALAPWRPVDALYLLGLGIVPTVVGHSVLNRAMRHLPGQTVAIANLFQFVPAGIMAWICFNEAPRPLPFAAATALVLAGAAIGFRSAARRRTAAAQTPAGETRMVR